MEFENSIKKKKSNKSKKSSQNGASPVSPFVALNKDDILWAEKEMFREKIYSKFLNDPLNMEKNIIKQVKRVKSNKPKHIEKASKLIDGLTALHNDSQRLLRYDVRNLIWRILIENYEFSPK